MTHAPSEQDPLVTPNRANSLPPLPLSEAPESSRALETPSLPTARRIDFWAFDAYCYARVTESIAFGQDITLLTCCRVGLAGFMVLFIGQLYFWESYNGRMPPVLTFFELGSVVWILTTVKSCLTAYWAVRVYKLSLYSAEGRWDHVPDDVNLFFGISGSIVDHLFGILHGVTQGLCYFTPLVYLSQVTPPEGHLYVDHIRAAMYLLLIPLAFFEDFFLNDYFTTIDLFETRRVVSSFLVIFYLDVWVPYGVSLVDGPDAGKAGFVDGRFLGGDGSVVWDLSETGSYLWIMALLNLADIVPIFLDTQLADKVA